MKYSRLHNLSAFFKRLLRQRQPTVPRSEFSTFRRKIYAFGVNCKLHPNCTFCTAPHNKPPISEILIHFKKLLQSQQHLSDGSGTEYAAVLETCTEKLPAFSDEELVDLMRCVSVARSNHSINVNLDKGLLLTLIKSLDSMCAERCHDWNLKTNLDTLELFYACRVPSHSQFAYQTFRRRHARIYSSPLPEVTRFFSLTCEKVNWKKYTFSTYNVQHYLESKFEELSAEDMAVYLRTLLQFQKPIVAPRLKEQLLKKFVAELSTMKASTSVQFLDFFCFLNAFNRDAVNCTPYVIECANYYATEDGTNNDETFANLAFAGLLSCRFLVYNPRLLGRIRRKLTERVSIRDIVEVSCALYSLAFFDYPCSDVLNATMRNQMKETLLLHPKRMVNLVWYLANAGIYHFELIEPLLREDFLGSAFGKKVCKFTLRREIFMLDCGLEIECADEYKGNRLRGELQNELNECFWWPYPRTTTLLSNRQPRCRRYCLADPYTFGSTAETEHSFPPVRLHYDRILMETADLLKELYGGGGEYAVLCHILHHFPRPNLLLSFDLEGGIRKIDESRIRTHDDDVSHEQWPYQFDTIKVRDTENVSFKVFDWRRMDKEGRRWVVFTVLVRNSTTKDAVPLDNEVAKVRQFKKLGFHVIGIVQDDWLEMSTEKKREFLRQSLES